MYIPVLTAEGVVWDYYVPTKSMVNSELWITNVVEPIHRWWQQRWKRLPSSEREKITYYVSRAISAAKAVISECQIQQESPLPNEKGLHSSEELLLRRSKKKYSTSSISKERLQVNSDSSDDLSEEVDHSEDLRPDVEEGDGER